LGSQGHFGAKANKIGAKTHLNGAKRLGPGSGIEETHKFSVILLLPSGIQVFFHLRYPPLVATMDGMAWAKEVSKPRDGSDRPNFVGALTIRPSFLMALA